MDKIGVCNLALQLIGVTARIRSEDEDSLERVLCFDWYDIAVGETLRAFPWRQFETEAELFASRTGIGRQPYECDIPDDCVMVTYVYDANGKVIDEWSMSGDLLVTKKEPVRCLYTKFVSDPNLWEPQFTKMVAADLAVLLCTPLQKEMSDTTKMRNIRDVYLQDAIAIEINGIRDVVRNGVAIDESRFY